MAENNVDPLAALEKLVGRVEQAALTSEKASVLKCAVELRALLPSLTAAMGAMQERVKELGSFIQSANKRIADSNRWLDELQTKYEMVTGNKEAIASIFAQLNKAHLDEAKRHLANLERCLQRDATTMEVFMSTEERIDELSETAAVQSELAREKEKGERK